MMTPGYTDAVSLESNTGYHTSSPISNFVSSICKVFHLRPSEDVPIVQVVPPDLILTTHGYVQHDAFESSKVCECRNEVTLLEFQFHPQKLFQDL
jgi:hypothetical protein